VFEVKQERSELDVDRLQKSLAFWVTAVLRRRLFLWFALNQLGAQDKRYQL
jgi:hypothetical protein